MYCRCLIYYVDCWWQYANVILSLNSSTIYNGNHDLKVPGISHFLCARPPTSHGHPIPEKGTVPAPMELTPKEGQGEDHQAASVPRTIAISWIGAGTGVMGPHLTQCSGLKGWLLEGMISVCYCRVLYNLFLLPERNVYKNDNYN